VKSRGVGSWVARRARMTPDRIALVHGSDRWSYASVHERVSRCANALRVLGVRRGDRVAYLGPNHPALLETLFAAGSLGAIFVPLSTRLAGPELVFCLKDSGSRVLVYDPQQADAVTEIRAGLEVAHFVAVTDEPMDAAAAYGQLLASAPASPVDERVDLDEPCMVIYTSGTTGRPKGATLTHSNVTWNCFNVLIDVDVASDEISLVNAPLFHTAALNMLCLPTLLKGGTAVLVPAFDPARTLDQIEALRVTWMFGVPAMYQAIAHSPRWDLADLSSLRILMCGGAPVPKPLIRTYLGRGLTLLQGYGMTEAAPGVLFLTQQMATQVGSAGKPSFFTDVRLTRPDLSDARSGEPGEILVCGPNVMSGYWGQREATAAAFVDEVWFRSGDVGVVDADGFFYIRDRIKDMFISGGENVYPAEVESVLYRHPDVIECAVIGVPDETWGEVGKALVVVTPGHLVAEDELLGFLQGKLAKFKIPKSVELTSALPHTGSGKVDKVALRARGRRPG
jgi:acyl-CoA synthetase (AMP-forming)/AMP-acid ligase II